MPGNGTYADFESHDVEKAAPSCAKPSSLSKDDFATRVSAGHALQKAGGDGTHIELVPRMHLVLFASYVGLVVGLSTTIKLSASTGPHPCVFVCASVILKLIASIALWRVEDGTFTDLFRAGRRRWKVLVQYAGLSLITVVGDILLFDIIKARSTSTACTFQVLVSCRTLLVIFMWQRAMNNNLQVVNWLGIIAIVSGCVMTDFPGSSSRSTYAALVHDHFSISFGHSVVWAFLYAKVIVLLMITSWSLVYNEMLLKGRSEASTNFQNLALYAFGILWLLTYAAVEMACSAGDSAFLVTGRAGVGAPSEMYNTATSDPRVAAVLPPKTFSASGAIFSREQWLMLARPLALSQVVAMTCLGIVTSHLLKLLSNVTKEVATGVQALCGMVVDMLVFGSRLGHWDVAGGGMIVVGVWIMARWPVSVEDVMATCVVGGEPTYGAVKIAGEKCSALPIAPSTKLPAKGSGKGPPPPVKGFGKGKAHGKDGGGRGAGGGKGEAGGDSGTQLPLGRKLHWKPLAGERLENTVWAEINCPDPQSPLTPRDASLFTPRDAILTARGVLPAARSISQLGSIAVLERLFKPNTTGEASGPAGATKPRLSPFPEGTKILDDRRAQNIAIVICRLGFDKTELFGRLQALNVEGVSSDCLEKCEEVIPTDEETEKLRAYTGDPSALRDIERQLLPLCSLSRVPQRLQIMIFDMQLQQQILEVQANLRTLVSAAEQARSSKQLKNILRVVLVLGNFMNHGTRNKSSREFPTKGFTVESLPLLFELKSAVHKNVTMLHYVVHRVLTSSSKAAGHAAGCSSSPIGEGAKASISSEGGTPPQSGGAIVQRGNLAVQTLNRPEKCPALLTPRDVALALRDELSLVHEASRISIESLRVQEKHWTLKMEMVASELKMQSAYGKEAIEAMRQLQTRSQELLNDFAERLCTCENDLSKLVDFFGEDPKKLTGLGLFTALNSFVDQFSKVADEILKQPAKFQHLLQTGSLGEQSKPSDKTPHLARRLPMTKKAKSESRAEAWPQSSILAQALSGGEQVPKGDADERDALRFAEPPLSFRGGTPLGRTPEDAPVVSTATPLHEATDGHDSVATNIQGSGARRADSPSRLPRKVPIEKPRRSRRLPVVPRLSLPDRLQDEMDSDRSGSGDSAKSEPPRTSVLSEPPPSRSSRSEGDGPVTQDARFFPTFHHSPAEFAFDFMD